jgi:hemerythrin
MALIAWNEGFSVGVGDIDKQHQQLIRMINDLNDAMKAGKGKEALTQIVKRLADYTVGHFGTEEKHFDHFNYPDKLNHKKAHAEFISKVSEFQQGLESGKVALSIQVMNFLSDWLKTHIQGVDKKYAPFFASHGLK